MTEDERKEAVELEQVLAEVPDDVLIGVMASRMQKNPEAEVKSVVQTVSRQQFYGGPIPPPIMLEEYEKTHKGLADRIVSMAEAQQQHRHSVETHSVVAAIKAESRGQHYEWRGQASLFVVIGGGKIPRRWQENQEFTIRVRSTM